MLNKSEQIIFLKKCIAHKWANTVETPEDFLDLKFSPYNIDLINGELNKIESSDMFSNNSNNSQVDNKNKNLDDIIIFNE